MKRLLFIILMFTVSLPLYAGNIVDYDTRTGNVKKIYRSVDTPKFPAQPGRLINPDLTPARGVELKHLKVVKGAIVEFTREEKAALKAIEDAAEAERLLNERIEKVNRYSGATNEEALEILGEILGVPTLKDQYLRKLKERNGFQT